MIRLRHTLSELKRASTPRPEFQVELRNELIARIGGLRIYRTTVIFRYALAPLALALLLGVGTTSYAFASPSVSEGHMLYPLKNGVEQVERKFYRTPEAKAYYHVKTFRRRVDEAGYVMEHGAPTVIFLERIPTQYDLTSQEIRAMHEMVRERQEAQAQMQEQAVESLRHFRLKVERAPMAEQDKNRLLIEVDRRLELLGE